MGHRLRVALAAVATALGGCGGGAAGGASPPGDGGIGAFAAYAWEGAAVESVHAAWRVPEIQEGSPCGIASTWIGAAGEGKTFIQIGTNEECLKPTRAPFPIEAEYSTFWSDTAEGYHPHFLYSVRAGDLIEATMHRTGHRWRLTIADDTNERRASFATTQETRRQPFYAEWVQEDVELGRSYAPYPRLSVVTLSDLLVNGKPPSIEQLRSSTMSVGAELLAPTGLRDDSFEVPARR